MKFVTDLSKGVLGTPDSSVLWTEILSHVPDSLLLKPDFKCLVVACGHCTEAILLAKRMQALGISADRIQDAIWVLDKYPVFTNQARKYGFKNIITADFLLWDPKGMKFDLVMGNPPYKNGGETGGASSLWRKFVKKTWGLVKDDGYLIMITPQFSNTSRDIGFIYKDFQTKVVWTQIANYFPGIGSSFTAWIVNKTPKTESTFFVDENLYIDVTDEQLPNDLKSISIIQKMSNRENFECLSSPEYWHTSVVDGKDEHLLSRNKSDKLSFLLRRTSGENYSMWGAILPSDYHKAKVVLTFSGNPHYQFHDVSNPIGTIKYQSGHILVNNEREGNNLICLYQSKLYKFHVNQFISGGMRGAECYKLPKLDLTRTWTDQELYAHFGLTEEEINYIESQVK